MKSSSLILENSVIIVLVGLNGLLAMSEIAMVTAREFRFHGTPTVSCPRFRSAFPSRAY